MAEGNIVVFEELISRYEKKLMRYIARIANFSNEENEEVLQEIYYASERAELTLKIIDGSALALRVAEQAETATDAVCTLSAKIKAASCQWLPLWTAKYDITIVNHGDSPVSYLLVTN